MNSVSCTKIKKRFIFEVMKRYLILICLSAFLCAACTPQETPEPGKPSTPELPDPTDPDTFVHTSLLYWVSPSLAASLSLNLNDLQKGDTIPSDHALLVYIDKGNGATLQRIRTGADGKIKVRDIKSFSSTTASTTETRIKEVLNYVQSKYPAETYGMLMSGHGNGWRSFRTQSSTKSIFTEFDVNPELYIELMAEVLPPYNLDYLLLDACLMGGIEVCYQLKEACDYIMASPTEIWSSGFSYDYLAQTLFPYEGQTSIIDYAQAYFQDNGTIGTSSGGATITVVKTAEMDGVATSFTTLCNNGLSVSDVDTTGMQHYDRSFNGKNSVIAFEFKQLANALIRNNTSDYANFLKELDEAVVYKASSTRFGSDSEGWITIDPDWYSGFSCFIPNGIYPTLQEEYKDTAWNKAVQLIE